MGTSDASEASDWVAKEIARLRTLQYDDLVRARSQPTEHRPMMTSAGTRLTLETLIHWDDREKRNLRVFVDVWDPGKAAPIRSIAKDDFIRAPDGSFIGE